MGKKTTTIRIDEDLLHRVKMEIPNFSGFIEDCLKVYFNITNTGVETNTIQDELNTIKQAQLNIHLLTKNDFKQAINQELNSKNQNKYWLQIWTFYRNTGGIQDAKVMEAAEKLNTSYSNLIDLMNNLLTFVPKKELSLCDDYQYAVKRNEELN